MIQSSTKWLAYLAALALGVASFAAQADVKPFILASSGSGDVASTTSSVKEKLAGAGFDVVGSYSPYSDAQVIIFTNSAMIANARKSERGGYGAALRVSVTKNGGNVEVVYTNPIYWANAYRLASNLDNVTASLKSALGYVKPFGSGDKDLSAEDMREYHYTVMMEYFDDPSDLGEYDSHKEAVAAVEANLKAGAGATAKVYRIDVGKDTEGNEMTLFGVALNGADADDCSGDKYIMDLIDHSSPRHTAHLPYELMVYGDEVEGLYARFRIAISWPHLPMMLSETGATFMSIMCAPGSIEEALSAAGGLDW